MTDHGVGISEDDQRQMFEPFRRFDVSKHNIPGVGLGLFVVRQIVRAHGGRIEVDSAPGQGTTVRVYLPRQQPDQTPHPVSPGEEPRPPRLTFSDNTTGARPQETRG